MNTLLAGARRAALLGIAACAFAVSAPASAALIASGTGLFDTETKLHWRGLDQTQGLSVNQALAANPVYSLSTDDQVATLFSNAGFVTGVSTVNPANDPAADLLLSLLGCTQFCDTVNALGRGFAEFSGSFTTRPFYASTGLGSQYALTSLLNGDLDFTDTTAGVYLVTAVPIPAAVWLMASGLGVLGWFGRRKASAS
jgi:hypothetical protein